MINKTQSKHIIVLMSLFLFTSVLKAQDDRDFRFGFKVSPAINWVKVKDGRMNSGATGLGFAYGLMGDFRLSENYAISTEFLITTFKSNVKSKPGDTFTRDNDFRTYSNLDYHYSLKYIQIPIAIKFKTKEIGAITYWGQFGIIPSFSIGNTVVSSAAPAFGLDEKYNPNVNDNNKYDFKTYEDNVNALRVAMLIGAGIEYRISGNTSITAGLRFDNGFTDFLNNKKVNAINNGLGLHLGVFF